MFYGAGAKIFEHAKALRKNMTPAETKLWEYLKGKKVKGLRFRPQHPIDGYIADFYCHPVKLVIEVDGGIHKSKDQKEYDLGGEADLRIHGIEILRFTNEEIENEIVKVVDKIQRFTEN